MGPDQGRLYSRYGVFSLIIWIALSISAFTLGQFYIDSVRDNTKKQALARAGVGAEALEQVLLRSVGVTETIQSLIQTRENLLLAGNKDGAAAIADQLSGIAAAEKFGVSQVTTIGADGWTTWSSTSDFTPTWLGDLKHFQAHVDGDHGIYVSKPLVGRASKRSTVQFTRRLNKPDGGFQGVTVVSFDLLKLSQTLADLRFGEDSVSTIWSIPDGELVARSLDAEKLLGRESDPDLQALVAARHSPSGTRDITISADGRRLLQAYRVVGQLPLLATVSLDADKELADADMLATWVFVAAAGLTLFAGTLLVLLVVAAARRQSGIELELVRSESRVAEIARARISQLLSGLPAAVYGANLAPDGAVLAFTITETAQRLTGWDMCELTSHQAWESKAKDIGTADWTAYFLRVIAYGDASVEYGFVRHDAAVAWLRDQARVVSRNDDGSFSVVGYVSDITRERTIQAQAFASSKLATLGEMATGLAHELNQPIATMSLAAENAAQMLEFKGSDGIQFALQRMGRIIKQAQRARTIINHLRIFGRQENEETGPVVLRAVMDGAMALVGSALRNSEVVVDINIDNDLPPCLGQLVLAEHVIVNLMLNARDAMEANPQDRPPSLLIKAMYDSSAEKIVVEIQDNGPGIPPALIERIFQPFFTTKEVGKGTGLGLSLCHGIMASFGGGIAARNVAGGGAVFVLTFCPCITQAEDKENDAPENIGVGVAA
jgi:C4-dicarboxylate-specific signal transduction histidine kinase